MAFWLINIADAPADRLVEGRCVALAWQTLPDLSAAGYYDLKKAVQQAFPDEPPEALTPIFEQSWAFISTLAKDDVVLIPAADGKGYHVGTVSGAYAYEKPGPGLKHTRSVEWWPEAIAKTQFDKYALAALSSRRAVMEFTEKTAVDSLRAALRITRRNKAKIASWAITLFMAINLLIIILGNLREAHVIGN